MIEELEILNVKLVVEFVKFLKEGFFKDYNVGCLYGKFFVKERDKILNDFKDGYIYILVLIIVVEVGINVLNVIVMVIENVERFGFV